MEQERFLKMVTLAMPAVVSISQWMGVGGFGWLSYVNVSLIVRPSFKWMKSAPKFSFAADDATHFKIVEREWIASLSVMGPPSLGNEHRKKWPDA